MNLWILKRLVELSVPIELLSLTYKLRIRVFVEQNVPLWMFSISKKMCEKIEKLQKIAIYIVLGKDAKKDYLCNLTRLNLETLEDRRLKLAQKFASKILKHPEHRKIFKFNNSDRTRYGNKVIVPTARTARYDKSTIPSLARIINQQSSHS